MDEYKNEFVTGEVGTVYEYALAKKPTISTCAAVSISPSYSIRYNCRDGFAKADGTQYLASYTCNWNGTWTFDQDVNTACAGE